MKKTLISTLYMTWPTLVIVLSILIIIRTICIFKNERSSFVLHDELINLLFIAYLLVLFELVTSQDVSAYSGTNLTPFKEIMRYKFGSTEFNRQVFGNILLFVPLGYFASRYCKLNGFFGIFLISLSSSFVIESVQRYIGRSFDVDDIILNVIGGLIGYLIYVGLNAIKDRLPRFMRKNWFYNLLSIILIVLAVIYCIKLVF